MEQVKLPALLLACLAVERHAATDRNCAQLAEDEWAQLHDLALQQRVSSLLWQWLTVHERTSLIPAAMRQRMQDDYYALAKANLRLYHDTGQVLRQLRAQAIKVMVLKGIHLGSTVYPNAALRQMNDVDLLVDQSDVPAVAAILHTLGYRCDEELVLTRHFATDHHLPRFTKAGSDASFEVHWLITYPDKAYTIPTAELWQRAQPVTVAGVTVLALGPEDLLLHICEHATYHHLLEQGIRFLCDIDALVRRYGTTLDWAAVQARATAWGWTKGVYLALTLARQLLNSPIPDAVICQLQPANANPALIDQAISHLFADQSEAATVSTEFAQMRGSAAWRTKFHLLGQRLFDPARIVQRYPVRPDSWQLYCYYPVRVKDLALRYAHTLWRLWRRDHALTATTQSKHTLATWFEQG